MDEKIKSKVTGKSYYANDAVRIVNIIQAAAYIGADVELLDLYVSKDYKTGKPIFVYVFDRESSSWAYDLWCKHELALSVVD